MSRSCEDARLAKSWEFYGSTVQLKAGQSTSGLQKEPSLELRCCQSSIIFIRDNGYSHIYIYIYTNIGKLMVIYSHIYTNILVSYGKLMVI